jgi:hypothetical protein
MVTAYRAGDAEIEKLLLTDYCKWVGFGIDNYLRIFNARRLVLYVDLQLFDQRMRDAIEGFARANENQVTAKCELRFASNGMELHLRAATSLALKNFLSVAYHDTLMKGV